ncbi:MAG TPA: hypothetical protein VGM30_24920 [Puia sp.]|jgi:hypothetical protein
MEKSSYQPLTPEELERWQQVTKDVHALKLESDPATISKETGYPLSQVSSCLLGHQPMTLQFVKRFYAAFYPERVSLTIEDDGGMVKTPVFANETEELIWLRKEHTRLKSVNKELFHNFMPRLDKIHNDIIQVKYYVEELAKRTDKVLELSQDGKPGNTGNLI